MDGNGSPVSELRERGNQGGLDFSLPEPEGAGDQRAGGTDGNFSALFRNGEDFGREFPGPVGFQRFPEGCGKQGGNGDRIGEHGREIDVPYEGHIR